MTEADVELPEEPQQDRQPTAYEAAHSSAVQALAITQERLRALRQQVKENYAEIKQLVAEEELLERMSRVTNGTKPRKRSG